MRSDNLLEGFSQSCVSRKGAKRAKGCNVEGCAKGIKSREFDGQWQLFPAEDADFLREVNFQD